MGFRNPINGVPPSSIDGGMIAPDSIGTEHLVADAITAKHTITGALIRTAASGKRWELDSSPANELRAYSGDADEDLHGALVIDEDGDYNEVRLRTPRSDGETAAYLDLFSSLASGTDPGSNGINLTGNTIGFWPTALGSPFDPPAVRIDTGSGSDPAGITIGGGRRIRELQFGWDSVSPNASGQATINHALAGTPTIVLVGLRVSNFNGVNADNYGSSTFRVTIFTAAGDPVTNGRSVAWLAIR